MESALAQGSGWRLLLGNALLFCLYVVTGLFGLKLDPVGGLATLIWPPSGIAVAALTLYGFRLWPGVALGALATNLLAGAHWPVASLIMAGNALEALTAAYALRKIRFNPSLSGLREALSFLAASLSSPILAACVGSAALLIAGSVQAADFPLAWRTWWLGDVLGIITVAPFLFSWAPSARPSFPQHRFIEAGALAAVVLLFDWFVFGGYFPASYRNYPIAYVLFLPSIWTALRFGVRGTVLVNIATLLVTVWGTLRGYGPFVAPTVYDSLLMAQLFIGGWTVSSLILASVVSERVQEKKYLLMQYRIAQILTVSTTLEEAASEILKAMGEALGWVLGAMWRADPAADRLACIGIWRAPFVSAAGFEEFSRAHRFERGIGLPGRVWLDGAPAWIADVTEDPNFPRAPYAIKAGLRSAFAFPLKLKGRTVGVIEFFNSEILRPDERVLDTFTASGALIGQFIAKIRAESGLAESEARFRATFELAEVGIAHVSKDGRWIRVNRRLCEILGYPPEELSRKTFQEITHPDDVAADVREAERLVAGEISTYTREKRYMRGDGSMIWANLTVSAVRDAEGAFQHFISVIEDTTDRKNYEERIKGVNERLRSLDRIRSEFVSMISHELRTPLTAIKEGIELTRDEIEGPLNDDQKSTLDVSRKNIDRLSRMVNNVLQFSRMDTGRIDLFLSRCDLAEASRDACELMRFTIAKKGIRFECDLPPQPLLMLCDADKIQQIIINLLDNAAKHTPKGGTIRFTLEDQGSQAVIAVRDTGIGIGREDLEKIFGIFERGELSRQMGITGGVGVGLAVSKKLAEQHAGSITVESEPGKGAIFTVRLPKKGGTNP